MIPGDWRAGRGGGGSASADDARRAARRAEGRGECRRWCRVRPPARRVDAAERAFARARAAGWGGGEGVASRRARGGRRRRCSRRSATRARTLQARAEPAEDKWQRQAEQSNALAAENGELQSKLEGGRGARRRKGQLAARSEAATRISSRQRPSTRRRSWRTPPSRSGASRCSSNWRPPSAVPPGKRSPRVRRRSKRACRHGSSTGGEGSHASAAYYARGGGGARERFFAASGGAAAAEACALRVSSSPRARRIDVHKAAKGVVEARAKQLEEGGSKLEGCEAPGDVKATSGFNLPAKHVARRAAAVARRRRRRGGGGGALEEGGRARHVGERAPQGATRAHRTRRPLRRALLRDGAGAAVRHGGLLHSPQGAQYLPREEVAHGTLRAPRTLLEGADGEGMQLAVLAMRCRTCTTR